MKNTDTAKHEIVDESVALLENVYPLWVYPAYPRARREKYFGAEETLDTEGGAVGFEAESFHEAEPFYETEPSKEAEPFYETEHFDSRARDVLASGGIVYLTPPATKEALPCSIKTQFTTDFWSVGTFPAQSGGMGQLIDADHPLFRNFPTEFHTNWQWWPMATQRAIILPEYKKSIVAEMDSYAYMRPMTQLLECRCGGGRLLLSSMGLQNLTQYPETRALQRAIYIYLTSDQFHPEQEMDVETIARLVP